MQNKKKKLITTFFFYHEALQALKNRLSILFFARIVYSFFFNVKTKTKTRKQLKKYIIN